MEDPSDKIFAVLTGDVVRSSRLPLQERSSLASALDRHQEAIRSAMGGDLLPQGMDTVRGDGFQAILRRPELALRVALFLRAAFRSDPLTGFSDLRIAVGIGPVDHVGQRVSEGLGPAFELSGRRLDGMKRGECLGVDCRMAGFDTDTWNVMLALVDAVAETWTQKQALAVSGALLGLTQQAIAERWPSPVRQQTVGHHLMRSGWRALKIVLAHFENSFIRLF